MKTELTGRTDSGSTLQCGQMLREGTGAFPAHCDILEIGADPENLTQVQAFVEEKLEQAGCPPKTMMQVGVSVEEIFINIASYAYAPGTGSVKVLAGISGEPPVITITFIDRGIPFDPLAKEDPDVALPAHERQIGGLGIFMTIKMMDEVAYEFRDGQNILTMKKRIL